MTPEEIVSRWHDGIKQELNQADLSDLAQAIAAAVLKEREACAKICDALAKDLNEASKNATAAGDDASMYRVNTAWHAVTNAAERIRTRGAS